MEPAVSVNSALSSSTSLSVSLCRTMTSLTFKTSCRVSLILLFSGDADMLVYFLCEFAYLLVIICDPFAHAVDTFV